MRRAARRDACAGESYVFECENVGLSAQRDELYLFDASGALCDWAFLRDIPAGGSYGRLNGENGYFYFAQSSRGADNGTGRPYGGGKAHGRYRRGRVRRRREPYADDHRRERALYARRQRPDGGRSGLYRAHHDHGNDDRSAPRASRRTRCRANRRHGRTSCARTARCPSSVL